VRDSNHAQARAKLFIVPRGQTTTTIYVEHKTRIGPFTFITREPQIINVQEYLKNQGYTIKIVEVSTIQEAINYFFT
jgi:predicted S18 family serine protease